MSYILLLVAFAVMVLIFKIAKGIIKFILLIAVVIIAAIVFANMSGDTVAPVPVSTTPVAPAVGN